MKHNFRLDCAFAYFLILFVSICMLPTAWSATLVVANKAEATASLINLDSGEVVATLPTGEGPHEVGISPNGQFAMVSNYGRRGSAGQSLTLIDISSASVVKTIDLGEYRSPHGVEWLDDARVAVTVESNQALIIVDVEEAKVSNSIKTDQQVSHMVALDPARQRAYTANMGSGSLTVLDLETGERLENIKTGKGTEGLTVSGKDGQIWVTNRDEDTITVLDGNSLVALKIFSSNGFPIRATATAKGQVLVTRARAGDLVIYDAASFEEIRVVSFDINSMGSEDRLFGDRFGESSVPIGVVVDDSGGHAFVAHANADVITEVDLSNGEIVRLLHAGREPDGMGYSTVAANTP
jgi:DNA-binding beta-propeller fold protein YncE